MTIDSGKLLQQVLLLVILYFTLCVCKDTMTLNENIEDGRLLVSKESNFALGFFSPGSSGYRYLGIWFYKVQQQAVVWVANRDHPINGSSGVLSLDRYGNLVLYSDSEQNVAVWSANVSVGWKGGGCVAPILDSGNLVLVRERSRRIVWESFDYPANTLVKGMKLGANPETGVDRFLSSWRSADDPGMGDYSLRLNPFGSPQLVLYKGSNYVWRSYPWPWKAHEDVHEYSLVFKQYEQNLTYFADYGAPQLIMRTVLEDSGLIKRYAWHEREGRWKEFYTEPRSRCDWYGICGSNSKCNPTGVTPNLFECACLPGYEPKSPGDWSLRDGSGGCIRKRQESSLVCGQGEGFLKVEEAKLPESSAAVWLGMSMSHIDCEQECMRNCSCSAYASLGIAGIGTSCLTWYGDLMDTEAPVGDGLDFYVRVDALELDNCNIYFFFWGFAAQYAKKSGGFQGVKAILVLPIVSGWLIIIIFTYLCLRKRNGSRRVNSRRKKRFFERITSSDHVNSVATELGVSESHPDVEIFSLNTMVAATNNFSPANKLGQGGFGTVYKGQLSTGQEVAVKRLSKESRQGMEEFRNEATLISMLQHRNLVKLLGCCIEGEEPMLIYEFLPNKSLDSYLFDERRRSLLDWRKRFNIILGIARGILYLHQDSRLRIIHRDIKCSNILLDADMNPKISDFGIARIFDGDQHQERTRNVVGTYGYMSPEYALFGKFSIKSDVFSFGVLLLEIISGKKNNMPYHGDPYLSLIAHVWDLWKEDRALEVVDSFLKESCHPDQVLRCIQIGLLCVQHHAADRPAMLEVVLMLGSETALPPPNQPAFIIRDSREKPQLSPLEEEEEYSINQVTLTTILSR